jgi:hypothetical protein
MSPAQRYAQKHAKARPRRRHKAHERLPRAHAQAQRAIAALEHALHALGRPDTRVLEIEGRRRRPPKWLGTIFGGLFPSLFGCRTSSVRARGRGWDKHLPSQIRGALPKRSWGKRRRRRGLEVVAPLWRPVQDKRPATHSRWQWPWAVEDSVCTTYGQPWGVGGTWWRGPEQRVRPGLDGVLLGVVMGDGTWVVPGDGAIRRPAPPGPGRPCRATRPWGQGRLEAGLAAWGRGGRVRPPPVVVAARGLGDAKLRRDGSRPHQGPVVVEGTKSDTLT